MDEVVEQNQVMQYKHTYIKLIMQKENFKKEQFINSKNIVNNDKRHNSE